MALQLSIVTPARPVVEVVAESVVVPGQEGEFGVLPEHEALLAPLGAGVIRYLEQGRSQRVAVSGGFAEVTGQRVTVLARTAEPAEEIDALRARQAHESAARQLEELGPLADPAEIEARSDELARAEARLEASAS